MAVFYPKQVSPSVVGGVTAEGGRYLRMRGPTFNPALPPVVDLHAYDGGAPAATWFDQVLHSPRNAAMDTGYEIVHVHTGPAWCTNTPPAGGARGFRAIDETLTAIGRASEPVCLLGVSMGGLHALAWAAAHPDRVAAVMAYVPALDLTHIWDGGGELRTSLEGAWSTSGRVATRAATAAIDPYRNPDDYLDIADRIHVLADTADTVVGYAHHVEWCEATGARLTTSTGLGHIAWPIGPAFDELDQIRQWHLAA